MKTFLRFVIVIIGSILITTKSDHDICSKNIINRVDCSSGVANLTKSQCERRGCCFDDDSCFYPTEGVPITTVHMINSNHFDAGYASLTADVINLYFDEYFPRAANVGKQLRSTGNGALRWMTFSYIVSLFFDCPSNMNLHCPNATNRNIVKNAIAAEDIVWPAFPHNAELATGDNSFLRFGVKLSQNLAIKLNGSTVSASVLSTRDVPGMPRASLLELKNTGVRALSEGMNGRMVPVNVPPAFVWKNEKQNVSKPFSFLLFFFYVLFCILSHFRFHVIAMLILQVSLPTLWHWHGYGSLNDPGDPISIPGSPHALAYCWRGDNEGPPMSAEEVINNTKKLENIYGSNVKIISSTLGDYVDAVGEKVWDTLPVITKDLSDTWIWGTASDPVKAQRMRSIARARSKCENSEFSYYCTDSDHDYQNFSRLGTFLFSLSLSVTWWGLSQHTYTHTQH